MEDVVTVTETENPVQAEEVVDAATTEGAGVLEEKTDIEKSKEGTPKGVQKRLDELTLKAKLAEEREKERAVEAEFWKNQVDKPPEKVEIVPELSTATLKPVLENFSTYDAYVEALTDWKIEQKDKINQQGYIQQEQAKRQSQRISLFETKVTQTADVLPDFEDVARDPAMRRIFSAMPDITDAIMENERGPEIAYYLGKNRQKAIELAQMHPVKAAIELGKIEAKLLTPETKKISQAPEPITPVGGVSSAGEDEDKMSVEELAAKYKRQRLEKFNKRR